MKCKLLHSVLLAILMFGLAIAVASAHASLIKSEPRASALLDRAPTEIKLWFDEPVEVRFGEVQVLDQNRQRVDLADLKYLTDDRKAIATSVRRLDHGSYTVLWKALSAADGHITLGVFAFSVGSVATRTITPAVATTNGVAETAPISVIARWLNLLTALTLVGGFFFRAHLLERGLRALDLHAPLLETQWRRVTIIAWGLALASALVSLVLQASTVADVPLPQAIAFEPISRTLVDTRFGSLLLARVGLLGAIVLALTLVNSRWAQIISLIFGPLLLLTFSFGSHSAGVDSGSLLPVLADWLHLFAGALWLGGLIYFFWAMRHASRTFTVTERARWIAWMVPQFSRLAIAATILVTITGVVSMLVQVPTLDALMRTLYGQTLTIKIILFIGMIALGAINLLRLSPRLRRTVNALEQSARTLSRFRWTLGGETLLGVGVVFFAGLLTLVPPARSTANETVPNELSQVAYFEDYPSPDLRVQLTLRPNLEHPTDFEAHVTNPVGAPPDILRVIFQFVLLDKDVGVARVNTEPLGEDSYSVKGDQTPLDGMWLLRVIVRRRGLEDVMSEFSLLRGSATRDVANEATALQWLKKSDQAMNMLTSLRARQILNGGYGRGYLIDLDYRAPDRSRFSVRGGTDSIWIGSTKYAQEEDGTWRKTTDLGAYKFPDFKTSAGAQHIFLGRKEILNGEETQIVRYRTPLGGGYAAEFAAWISVKDKRVRQLAMVAPGHFMTEHYLDYDADFGIEVPE